MDNSSLFKKLYGTVHRDQHSVEEIADHLGVSATYLYRMVNPDDPTELKLAHLIPLIEFTRNYSLLHHLAHRLGFICVKVPRARKMKPEEMADHQKVLSEYTASLHKFLADEVSREECLELVDAALREVAGAKKMVEAGAQQELF